MGEERRTGATEAGFGRELLLLLNELRVALPGVQILFAFLLSVPFSQRFGQLTGLQRSVYFAGFACAAASSALLIAPSVYHRLHWRQNVVDTWQMLRSFSRLAAAGSIFLALAMTCTLYVITDFLYGAWLSLPAAGLSVIAFGWLWYGFPMARRVRDRRLARARGG